MEGHFASAIHLLDVPKNVEWSDRLPLPNSWPPWVIGGNHGAFSAEKNSIPDSNSASEEFFQGSAGGAGSSSPFEALSNQSLWQNPAPLDYMDFQLYNNLEGAGQADDLFLNSLLEDFHGDEELHGSFCDYPDCRYEIPLAENMWLNPSDLDGIPGKKNFMESSNCCESHCFSPSLEWEKEIAAPQSVPCSTEKEMISTPKASLVHVPDPSKQSELSLEESVLQDLKMVMAQLSKKTRICVRDALYRLADNSKQHHLAVVDESKGLHKEKPPPWTEHNQTTGSEKRTMESETNIIDRAVANIMFNRVDFNNQGFSVKPLDSLEDEILSDADAFQIHGLGSSILSHDHEVPAFTQSN